VLKAIPSDDPIADGWVLILGAVFFFVNGVFIKQVAGFALRRSRFSVEENDVGLMLIMRPMCFVAAVACLYFAYLLFRGRSA
jgi:hypothetical protein